ncbi:MAG: DUF1097 domain-containing protein [Rhodospirillum sp.]|nr:DUF1097 domain-containing protein [Rhodospirillum sp.]MCF8491423.1 DUF1097 domain-containing protein [Rhodospirillum sp.]MCF8500950.1 DUF1097 domain-containing protein [Rhodospirillum sp.]
MGAVLATALSVGILGAVCTWFFLTAGTILVWAAFVAWACFFHSGGDAGGLKSTMISNLFGSVVGWVGALMILIIPLGDVLTPNVWAGVVVLITVVFYIMSSRIPALASVPGTTYGYACTFAFLLQTQGKLDLGVMTSVSLDNAVIVVPISMWLGALFGFASAKFAAFLTKPEAATA